jgi:C4-dicarboxylate-specific signal transduction histidine kinase
VSGDGRGDRIARDTALHQHFRDLLAGFSQAAFTNLSITAALETLVGAANEAFGARRTDVWLYERRTRELALAASSAGPGATRETDTVDASAAAARGLRLERAQLLAQGAGRVLVAPLRGSRRALGTLLMEGGAVDAADDQCVELAEGFARQLAVAIENVSLLDEVLRQRRLLEDTFNSLSDLVVVTDGGLRVVQTNNLFAARAGATTAELMNRPLGDLIGRAMAAWVESPDSLDAAASGDGQAALPRRFDDERLRGTFAVTVTPLINRDGEPAGRVVVARDITDQTRLEAEQAALRERLAQSEKLASLGQFVAGVAHEMNNPLQAVLGHLELLIATSTAARPLRRELRRIYNEGERAAKIVQNLLMFTGSHRMKRRSLALDTIVSRALASRRVARRRAGIAVVRTRGQSLPPVVGDALLLYQAILNVLINAEHAVADAAPGARHIEVRTATAAGGGVVLSIRDTGAGIPPEVLAQMFDPFFTTRDVGQGSGLGLTIAYGIIQEHGGTIRASSAPGGGAVFAIELPAAQRD